MCPSRSAKALRGHINVPVACKELIKEITRMWLKHCKKKLPTIPWNSKIHHCILLTDHMWGRICLQLLGGHTLSWNFKLHALTSTFSGLYIYFETLPNNISCCLGDECHVKQLFHSLEGEEEWQLARHRQTTVMYPGMTQPLQTISTYSDNRLLYAWGQGQRSKMVLK